MSLLEVKSLSVQFENEGRVNYAVDNMSFAATSGRILGIVGESGCGKSVSAMSILRLVPNPPGKISGGEIIWKDRNLLKLPLKEMQNVRGREIAMIFQDPMASLNPVFTIRRILGEVLKKNFGIKGEVAERRMVEAMREVGIPDPQSRLSNYPHEMSGGMKQRVMIALALMLEPELLIADEPTTALDVTIQKQILSLMRNLQQRTGMGIILITHDIGVIAETCDNVIVMYAGQVVEKCDVYTLFDNPRHPYTHGLLNSVPKRAHSKDKPLPTIEGTVPSLFKPPEGCRFAPRCPFAQDKCFQEEPVLRELESDHSAACHFPLEKDS